MLHHENHIPIAPKRQPWNKGKLIGPKLPLRPKHVWSIRTKLQIDRRTRDLAMFNLAIESKLRGCDVVALKVEDVAPSGSLTTRQYARLVSDWIASIGLDPNLFGHIRSDEPKRP